MTTIRELTPRDDFFEVGQVYVESWRSAYQGIVPQNYLNKLTPERWSGSLSVTPSASLGIFLDGKIIGSCFVSFARHTTQADCGEIVGLYLRPEYIGFGYGRALMEAAIEKLKNEGCTNISLWALEQNLRAEGFYLHMGFSPSGRTQTELIGGAALKLSEYCRALDD